MTIPTAAGPFLSDRNDEPKVMDETTKIEKLEREIGLLMKSEGTMLHFVANSSNAEQIIHVSGELSRLRYRLASMQDDLAELIELRHSRIRRERRMNGRHGFDIPRIVPTKFYGIQEVPAQ